MINHLFRFLKSCERYPQVLPFLNQLSSTHGIIINHPIQLIKHSTKGYGIKSLDLIKPNSNIINMSINKCLSSHYFTGSTMSENNKFDSIINSFQSLNQQKDQDIIKTCKIVLQLIVSMNTPSFEHHQYSKYLNNINSSSFHNLSTDDIETIRSQRLISLIFNSQKKIDSIAKQFHRKFPFVSPQLFLKMYVLARSRVLKANQQMVLSPIIDMINHSFTNNCEVYGKYLVNNSFLILKSTKTIQPQQQLYLNYGQLSNNELFFKYNFVIRPNPYSYLIVRLNYDESEEYSQVLFEQKRDLLDKLGGLPEIIKVYRTHIDQQSLKILRLYFIDENDISPSNPITQQALNIKVSNNNQIRVINFLISNLHTTYRFMHDGDHTNSDIEYIQNQQIIIIKDYLDELEKQLKQLTIQNNQ